MTASSIRALFVRPQFGKKAVEIGFLAPLATHPDGTSPLQVADDDPVVVALADGDLVDADGPRGGHLGSLHLLAHVELVEFFDGTVVQVLELGHGLVRHVAAELAHLQGKAPRIARVTGQPVEAFYMHAAAPRAVDAPALELKVDSKPGHRKVAHPAGAFIVAASEAMAAA